jgi:glutamyl-Q tRNA(Asp) synthetase
MSRCGKYSTAAIRYRGRFAPSPTGALHFGSLVAAVGSFLDARHNRGEWLVRIEDLDPPREVPGADSEILHTLEALGMEWDGAVAYQSRRGPFYEQALEMLQKTGMAYPCCCSRSEIAQSAREFGRGGSVIYPGTCRNGLPQGRRPRSLRVLVDNATPQFDDRLHGTVVHRLADTAGDFIIRRADRLTAYQLAVVVDDNAQAITHVVRGSDLLDSTPRQVYLQQLLGFRSPRYMHLPVATNRSGEKLSKQTKAPAVSAGNATRLLLEVLRFLCQNPPDELQDATPPELWSWAIRHWGVAHIPRVHRLRAPENHAD